MSQLDKMVDAIKAAQAIRMAGDAEFEIKTLRAIEDWAKASLPFKVGDRVQLREGYTVPRSSHGWNGFRDRLVGGACGIVREVQFNVYLGKSGGWQYAVAFDWDEQGSWFTHSADNLRGAPLEVTR